MTIKQIYVQGIRAEGQLQYQARSGRSTRWSALHLRQSPLDRACGIHALLIATAIVTRAPRLSMENLAESSRGQWRAFWDCARALYFEGASPRELLSCAKALDGLAAKLVRTDNEEKLHRVCLAAIESGGVPLVELQGPNLAHWTVVLGVEDRAGIPSALLCLDPSAGAPWAAFTNARYDLSPNGSAKSGKPLHVYRDTDGLLRKARVRNVLLVMAADRPP